MAAEVLERYPHLGGIRVELKDGNLVLRNDPTPPPTQSILLLGTATDGPYMQPTAVDAETAELIFGKVVDDRGRPNGATLLLGFEEAWGEGARDIRLMRISGKTAEAKISAMSRTVVRYLLHSKEVGPVAGNLEATFNLSHLAVDGTVQVMANGVPVDSGKVTVDNSGQFSVVTLAADAVDAGAQIAISYRYFDGSQEVPITEWGEEDLDGTITPWVAQGQDQDFTLDHIPVLSGHDFVVRIKSGAVLPSEAYTLSGQTLTLRPGFAPMGSTLEVRYTYAKTETVTPEITVRGIFPGSVYNGVKVRVLHEGINDRVLEIEKPASKRSYSAEAPLRYSSARYPLLRDLVNAVNEDSANNVVRLVVSDEHLNASTNELQVTTSDVVLTGGDDELLLTKDELYNRLHEAYQMLENYTVDYIVPLGVYADDQLADPNKNFAEQLALICAIISYYHHPTQGIIATTSPADATLQAVEAHVQKLLAFPNRYVMKDTSGNELTDSEGKPYDLGRYINVLAGPDRNFVHSRLGRYSANSAAAYAGFLSQLPPQSSPMNKPVVRDLGLRFTYSNRQRDALTAARYVTYKLRGQGTLAQVTAIEDAPTAALPGSDFAREAVVRQVNEAIRRYRLAAEPFLGEPPTLANQNALDTALSKVDDELVNVDGVLERVSHRLIVTPLQRLLGEAEVELEMVPAGELRVIRMRVTLRPA